ncbi:MAG: recombinase family protein, partial [Polyangiaceae bacterium]
MNRASISASIVAPVIHELALLGYAKGEELMAASGPLVGGHAADVMFDDAAAKLRERDGISSRTYEALMVRARSGFNAGGKCFGYANKWVVEGNVKKRTEYVIDEAEAAIVREIFELYSGNHGLRAIAKILNGRGVLAPRAGKRGTGSWSTSAIRPMLQRDRYRGVMVYGRLRKTYKKGTKVRVTRTDDEIVTGEAPHLRIVSDDLWNAAQEKFRRNRPASPRAAGGRLPKYMLSSLARCAQCGGPIHAKRAKLGSESAMVYVCGYYQDRAACKNSLRRPVSEVNAGCVDWIKENVLREEVVVEILKEVRKRVLTETTTVGSEIPALSEEATRLRREIENLAEGIARTGGSIPVLADKLAERQRRLATLDARLQLLRSAPDVIALEVRRMEVGARKRIAELRAFLDQNQDDARNVVESLLDGPLTFTPIETSEGKRYQVEGRITTGALLRASSLSATLRPQGDVRAMLELKTIAAPSRSYSATSRTWRPHDLSGSALGRSET